MTGLVQVVGHTDEDGCERVFSLELLTVPKVGEFVKLGIATGVDGSGWLWCVKRVMHECADDHHIVYLIVDRVS